MRAAAARVLARCISVKRLAVILLWIDWLMPGPLRFAWSYRLQLQRCAWPKRYQPTMVDLLLVPGQGRRFGKQLDGSGPEVRS